MFIQEHNLELGFYKSSQLVFLSWSSALPINMAEAGWENGIWSWMGKVWSMKRIKFKFDGKRTEFSSVLLKNMTEVWSSNCWSLKVYGKVEVWRCMGKERRPVIECSTSTGDSSPHRQPPQSSRTVIKPPQSFAEIF